MSTLKFKPGWRDMVLLKLREGRPLSVALSQCGVGKAKLNTERRRDPEFDKQVEEAVAAPRRTLQW